MALGSSLAGGIGAGGNLGTLFINLRANAIPLVKGMKEAEAAVVGGSARMGLAVAKMSGGVVLALGAIGAAGVVQFGQFEKAMVQSTAIMGDVSAALRAEMEATARQIATNSVTSAEELAESYFFLASAGLTAEQSIAALNVVNSFAIAGQFDMALATDLLTDAQSALGLTVDDTAENMKNMTRVSDTLVKANTLANATVQQFSFALTREAGAAMKAFSIDVEEGTAVLAAFADQGVKGEIAGTSFSRILRLMTSAAVNNSDAFTELNVEVFDPLTGNINNMADIIGDLENALGGMADETRVVALEQLGFKARVQGVILPLLGTSEAIRGYEKEMRRAGGITEEVSEKQMKSFFAQLTITWNRIKDILLTIGKELTPALRVLNTMLGNVIGSSEEMNGKMSVLTTVIGPGLVAMIGTIGDVFWGLRIIFKGVQLAMIVAVTAIVTHLDLLAQAVVLTVNGIIKAFNKIPKINIPEIGGLDTLTEFKQGLIETTKEIGKEMKELANESFSDKLVAGYKDVTATVKAENDKITKDIEATADEAVSDFERVQRAQAVKTISGFEDEAFGKADVGGNRGGGSFAETRGLQIGGLGVQAEQMQLQQQQAEDHLAKLEEISESEVELSKETQDRKLELIKGYNQQIQTLQFAQARIVLGTATDMFTEMANVTETFAGRQSSAYKAMFLASKAFAIADATVSIAQGIAKAAGLGFPMGIIGIAQVVAATSSIISSIQSTQMEFGGGKESGGPVSPGKSFLVGEAGPEMFSPSSAGNIIPNDQLGGGNVKVVVNNFTDAKAEVRETSDGNEKTIEVVIGQTKNSIAADIKQGTGNIGKAMQSAFGLKRNGK